VKCACGLLLAVLLSLLSSTAIAEDTLRLFLGVEQWEDGKKSERWIEKWALQCTGSGPTARCQLDRTVFIDCLGDQTTISTSQMSSENGRIRVLNLDREQGRLDFSLAFRGGGPFTAGPVEPAECVVTFDPTAEALVETRSLLCRGVHRGVDGSVTVMENRLPRFSYYWKPKCGFWMPGEHRTDNSLSILPKLLSRQAHIRQSQERLKAVGFDPGPIDGVMGQRTRDALRLYQETRSLPVTGELDDATFKALGIQ